MKYSKAFKISVLKKVLPPEEQSVAEVAKEMGVAANTVYLWLKKAQDGKLEGDGSELSPIARSAKEKLKLLLEGKSQEKEQLGSWLREKGLHTEHLSLYEQELSELVSERSDKQKEELRQLKKRNKELERELARKEKALAEVAALLTLKKKWDAFLEEREAD